MSIGGVIVAGGRGTRIGDDKPLMPFRGGTLIDAVIARVRPQVGLLALNVPQARVERYRARYDLPLLVEAQPGFPGPLAGVLAGLDWLGPGMDWLASFPCDTPFLPEDLVQRLRAARQGARPVVIRAGAEIHALCALWPRACTGDLRAGMNTGALVSVRRALAALDAVHLDIASDDPGFFNINTKDDLAEAERRAGRI